MDTSADRAGRGVLVIGAGASGMTTALCLARRGIKVTIIAERFAPHVTSVVAGALWEWPPAVCGYHNDQLSLARAKVWCETSYGIFSDLSNNPATGVFLRTANFYFKRSIDDDPNQTEKMAQLRTKVRGFRRDPALIATNGINPELGLRDAYSHLAPMVDTDRYMRWLSDEVRSAGCRVVERRLSGSLIDQAEALEREFDADALVNCTGLGARELTGDRVYPLRGALIRINNDGRAIPRITEAHCVAHHALSGERGFIFIVPRGDDMLVLGGLAEPEESNLNIGLDNYEPIRAMLARCREFLPVLARAQIDAAEPVRVGLRPVRPRNVRLEPEPGAHIIHNYGHGGSGITLSWGCALEVVERVLDLTLGRPAADTRLRVTPSRAASA
jgi:D-amino-acid oxidase